MSATTHIRYAYTRDGKLHNATICDTPELAEQAARVYCVNTVKDKPGTSPHGHAFDHMKREGRVKLVELYCREMEFKK